MALGKRAYWIAALIAVFALAAAAVTYTSRMTLAGGSDGTPTAACEQDAPGDDAAENEAADAPDDDAIENECGPQDGVADSADANDTGTDTVVPCSDPTGADDDAAEAKDAHDTDNIDEQCGPQDEAD